MYDNFKIFKILGFAEKHYKIEESVMINVYTCKNLIPEEYVEIHYDFNIKVGDSRGQ